MNQITMRVTPDGDGVWQIHLELCNEHFSGSGWFWGGPESLENLASHLTHYPLLSEATLQLGYGRLQGDDLMIYLSINSKGPTGLLEARVEIADFYDKGCRLRGKLLTSYASLDRFVPQLRALVSGRRGEAVLLGG